MASINGGAATSAGVGVCRAAASAAARGTTAQRRAAVRGASTTARGMRLAEQRVPRSAKSQPARSPLAAVAALLGAGATGTACAAAAQEDDAAALAPPTTLPFELPPGFDVDAACEKDTGCLPCKVFCKSECRTAYWRATECFDHWRKKDGMTEASANAGCLMHLLSCLWQHEGLQERLEQDLAREKQARKERLAKAGIRMTNEEEE